MHNIHTHNTYACLLLHTHIILLGIILKFCQWKMINTKCMQTIKLNYQSRCKFVTQMTYISVRASQHHSLDNSYLSYFIYCDNINDNFICWFAEQFEDCHKCMPLVRTTGMDFLTLISYTHTANLNIAKHFLCKLPNV